MERFGNIPLLITTILLQVLFCSVVRSHFCKRDVETKADIYTYNALSSLFAMATLVVVGLLLGELTIPSTYTILLGVVYGLLTALCAVAGLMAFEIGPLSYTTVITSCSMILPALSGLIFWKEPIALSQIIGVGFMLASFACSVDSKNDRAGASVRWLLLCLGAFASSGGVGILQKVHQSSPHQGELNAFLVISFGVSALFSLVTALFLQKKKKQRITVLSRKKCGRLALMSLAGGLGAALTNQINTYLAGAMPSIVFFPVFNGVVMLSSVLFGLVVYREKLSFRQWIGLAVGTMATLLLCGLF